jgi:hypothetical protein
MLFVARTGTAVLIACAAAGCGTAGGGEKSNPIDVRFDAANDRLYVKFGRGILAGAGYEYLHEFDLVHRRHLAGPRVDWTAFPAQCPEPSQS